MARTTNKKSGDSDRGATVDYEANPWVCGTPPSGNANVATGVR